MPRKIKQGKRDKEYQRKDSILYRQYGKTSLRRRHLNGETKIWKQARQLSGRRMLQAKRTSGAKRLVHFRVSKEAGKADSLGVEGGLGGEIRLGR